MGTTFNSLLVDASQWHDGDGKITYSFQSRPATYYDEVDTDGDGETDSWLLDGDELTVEFGADVRLNGLLREQTDWALESWNDVANVNLVKASSGTGDITIGAASFGDESLFGFVSDFAGRPGRPSPHGDLWLNLDNPLQTEPLFGTTGTQTLIHELGHSLGLHHPDEDPNNDAEDPRNNNAWTVMSYDPHPGVDGDDPEAAYPITPMIFDIQAIQALYGANLDTRTKDTNYISGRDAVYALGEGGTLVSGVVGILTIWDAGGRDTIDASNQSRGVKIDLKPGTFSTIGGVKDNVAVAAAVRDDDGRIVNYLENANGGRGEDTLSGNDAGNILRGNDGDDRLALKGKGDDDARGGRGNDIAEFGKFFTAMDKFDGGDGNDRLKLDGDYGRGVEFGSRTIRNVEVVELASGDDYLLVLHDDNVAEGRTLKIDGGKLGRDHSVQIDGSAETDGAFQLYGGRGVDQLLGGEGDDLIKAGEGNDSIAGLGGADELRGGKGSDVFFYYATSESRGGAVDRILDWDGNDRLELSDIDANRGKSGDQAFHLGGGGGHAGDVVVRYDRDGDETVVSLYVDANSSIDMQIILDGRHDLVTADFVF